MEPRKNIEKFDIKLKTKPKDGVILQLHHTIRGPNGACRRIRFVAAAFDDNYEKLACADSGGNIFILDFADLKFWKLTGAGPCTALQFDPSQSDVLIVATAKQYEISFVDTETSAMSRTLSGHTAPVKHISFSNCKTRNLLTASPVEAILWELRNYTKYFTLNTYLGAQIQHILFTPAGDYLVSCFQNDTVQIWKHESMKSVKQIIPNELKNMKTLAFTMNGRAMAMAGLAPTLILFSMDTWKALKCVNLMKFNISGAQQIAFVPQVFDGGSNKILGILSNDCSLYLLDLDLLKVIFTITPESSGIKRFIVSPSGKYFACILQLGEVNIYNTSHVLDMAAESPTVVCDDDEKVINPSTSFHKNPVRPQLSSSKIDVEHKMRTCMDSARLRRILMQYGEYPNKYRSMIWKSLLNTPKNKTAYAALIEKGIHPAYKNIEKQFTIHSSGTLKNLKRLLSCLSHWCPLFGVMKFLPNFTFPFVKVLQKDPLLLFECVATILINYCQLWFEYAPFPPISILAMIENVLAEHDEQLLSHMCKVGITSQTYALKLLESAFSEVLSCSEWLILWDHILSNEPAFLLMTVASYSIVQRNVLKKLRNNEEFDKFFHMQNPIDMKTFLKKAYVMLNETPEDIHPRKFLNSFVALDKGDCYQQFSGYPKATISLKLARKERQHRSKINSLRELTTKAQEQVIKERTKSQSKIQDNEDGDDKKCRKHYHKCSKKQNNFDHIVSDTVRERFVDSILYPATVDNYSKKLIDAKSSKRESARQNSKCQSPQRKRTENSQKRVEKLAKSCNERQSD